MTQASIHVKVKFKSSNGFESIEQGYSRVGNIDTERDLLFRNAILSASQIHINHGGTYDSKYNILSTSIAYFTVTQSGKRKFHEKKIVIDRKTQDETRKKIEKIQKNKREASRHGEGSTIKKSSMKTMYKTRGKKMTKKKYENKIVKKKHTNEHKELLRLRKENVQLRKQLAYYNKVLKQRKRSR